MPGKLVSQVIANQQVKVQYRAVPGTLSVTHVRKERVPLIRPTMESVMALPGTPQSRFWLARKEPQDAPA